MKQLIKNAKIVTPTGVIEKNLLISDSKLYITTEQTSNVVIDAKGKYILPGFFETHMHGINSYGCLAGKINLETFENEEGFSDSINNILKYLPKIGVTSTLLSSSAAPKEFMDNFFMESSKYLKTKKPKNTKFIGIDLEGNFAKDPVFAGAQDESNFLRPSIDVFEEMQEKSGGIIKKALIAPEWGNDAFKLMRYMTEHNLCPSVGHTGCTKQEMLKAYDNGTKVIVHTGNGPMSQNFKSGGALDGVFELGEKLYAEIICDFNHINPFWINTFINCFSINGVIGVSDSTRLTSTNLKEGTVVKGSYIKDGAMWVSAKENTLAGSITPLDKDFNNMINLFTSNRKAYFQLNTDEVYTLEQALSKLSLMFSLNPARLLNEDANIGSIEDGKSADIIIADIVGETGNYNFNIESVYIDGKEVLI